MGGIIYPGAVGSTGTGLPTPIPSDTRQEIHPDGSGGALWRQTAIDELTAAFTGTIVLHGSVNGGPNGVLPTLVERGDIITAVTAVCTYSPGAATAGAIATVYTGATDGGDATLGPWTLNSPFTSGSATGTSTRTAAGTGDPTMTCTNTFSNATSGNKTCADSVAYTYPVYDGLVASSMTPGAIVAGAITGLATKSVQQTRALNSTRSPSTQRWLRAFPDIAPWNTGTPVFVDGNGITFDFQAYVVVSVTNGNGIACDYRAYLSTIAITGTGTQCKGT